MLKPNKLCNVCKTIEDQPKLKQEIYESRYYVKSSRVTLLDLTKKYEGVFSYDSIRAHVKKHQFLNKKQLADANTAAIAKNTEKRLQYDGIKSSVVWDSVIGEGMRRLQEGEMEMKTADLLKAAKDKSDYELKVKDQELQMAEMVAFFASGEGNLEESRKYDRRIIEGQAVEDYDPTLESSADTDRRQNQSRAFYQSLAGDAPSPGTN